MVGHKHWHCRSQVLRPLAASLIVALAIQAPNRSWASNLIVSNCGDSGTGSLRDAVSRAATGDTVDLTRLQCSSITLTGGEIASGLSNLSLIGPGASALYIKGGYPSRPGRIFDHTGTGTLSISAMTVGNGFEIGGNGGCIYSRGSISLFASTVTRCNAAASAATEDIRGGAVYTKGELRMQDSTINYSQADCYGPTGPGAGGGAFVSGGFIALSSTISHNKADCHVDGLGGGVFASGSAYIASSSIFSNFATYAGGLFIAGGTGQSATIANSTIAGNNASLRVGGVYSSVPVTLQNSTIANNSAYTALTNLPTGFTVGVGLELYYTTANIQSTIIAGNTTPARAYDVGGLGSASTIAGTSQNNLIRTSSLALPSGTLRSDPLLGSLTYSGAKPPFLPLMAGSPAIDAGNAVTILGDLYSQYDQRGPGFPRVVGKAADIGAYETQSTGITTIVGNCADSGAGSLRVDLAKAESGDTLDLRPLHCTITLTSGELTTRASKVTLVGPGADLLTIDGNLQGRVLSQYAYGNLTLSGMTLTRGYSQKAGAVGGCVFAQGTVNLLSSKVTLCRAVGSNGNGSGGGIAANRIIAEHSEVTGNVATGASPRSSGGGLFAQRYISIDQSTISGNDALSGYGGGIYLPFAATALVTASTISGNLSYAGGGLAAGNAKIVNSTVSGNSATNVGGIRLAEQLPGNLSLYNSTVALNISLAAKVPAGIYTNGNARLQSSIVFGNVVNAVTVMGETSTSYDIGGPGQIVGANNLIGTSSIPPPFDTIRSDPLVGPLQNNGGPTFTHALLANSPAIDTGSNLANLAFDQRGTGFARVSGAAADIGAFETQDTIFANGFEQAP
jgi:hypothetical protein